MPLTDTQIRICNTVVRKFLEKHEATSRTDLLKEFKTSLFEPLQLLTSRSVLWPLNQIAGEESYLPRAVAFYYAGEDSLSLARYATLTVLSALRNLFELALETERKTPFSPQDAFSEARRSDPDVQMDTIWLGLYLVQEFSVFYMRQNDDKQIGVLFFRPSEQIYTVTETDGLWDKHIQVGINSVDRDRTSGVYLPEEEEDAPEIESTLPQAPTTKSRKIFVVHGRDKGVLSDVSEFLKSLGLEVVILYKEPNQGRTVIEKFEKHSDVGFAVVLLTPDDLGGPIDEPEKKNKKSAPERNSRVGYFIAKLGRDRVCPLQIGEVELPSDIHGVLWVPYTPNGEWRLRLKKEIEAAGIDAHPGKSEGRP